MTDKGLYWFKCSRCNKDILSYILGHREYRNGDMFFVPNEGNEFRAYRKDNNEQDVGSYFHPIIGIKRLCMSCSKGEDIVSFGDTTQL